MDLHSVAVTSAAPHTFKHDGNLPLLATAFHQGALRSIARRTALDTEAQALWETYGRLVEEGLPRSAQYWQPELGSAIAAGEAAPVAAVVHALFAVHAVGIAGQWRASLAQRTRISMAGHVFDVEGCVEVSADGDSVRIVCTSIASDALVLLAAGPGWRLAQLSPSPGWCYCAPQLLSYPGFEHVYLLPWGAQSEQAWPRPYADPGKAALTSAAEQVDQALRLLAVAGAGYLDWLKPLLRGIGVRASQTPGAHESGSHIHFAGVFYCDFPVAAESLAEAIVHEVSHQHFHLVNGLLPLVQKGHEEEKYFSSLKGQQRPLVKVLLAFHASANMTLFWHDLIARAPQARPQRARELACMLAHTLDLAHVLVHSKGMSDAGNAMFQTQAALLGERGYAIAV